MSVYEITSQSLTKELGQEVPQVLVVIAKHEVMGVDSQGISEITGESLADIELLQGDPLYKSVKGRIAGEYAEQTAKQTSGWDAIESTAIDRLMQRLPYEKDSEFLLKVAAVANRATRKHAPQQNNVLDPSLRAGRTTITLTQRLVSRLNRDGAREQEETRELSIRDGSMSNPSFQEIDSLLTVRNNPVLPRATEIRTHTAEPNMDDLLGDLMKRTK